MHGREWQRPGKSPAKKQLALPHRPCLRNSRRLLDVGAEILPQTALSYVNGTHSRSWYLEVPCKHIDPVLCARRDLRVMCLQRTAFQDQYAADLQRVPARSRVNMSPKQGTGAVQTSGLSSVEASKPRKKSAPTTYMPNYVLIGKASRRASRYWEASVLSASAPAACWCPKRFTAAPGPEGVNNFSSKGVAKQSRKSQKIGVRSHPQIP